MILSQRLCRSVPSLYRANEAVKSEERNWRAKGMLTATYTTTVTTQRAVSFAAMRPRQRPPSVHAGAGIGACGWIPRSPRQRRVIRGTAARAPSPPFAVERRRWLEQWAENWREHDV